jgi:hypothetical protein
MPYLLKDCKRFAGWMKSFAHLARKATQAIGCLRSVQFIFFGNRWEPDDVPRLHAENMSYQIIFVQTLHDQNDAAIFFVI